MPPANQDQQDDAAHIDQPQGGPRGPPTRPDDNSHTTSDTNGRDQLGARTASPVSLASSKFAPADGEPAPPAAADGHQLDFWPTAAAAELSPLSSAAMSSSGLLYYSREPLALKDFGAEVRAPMDIEQFAHQAELLLNLDEVSMEAIVGAMLAKALAGEGIGLDKLEQARDALFVRGSLCASGRGRRGASFDRRPEASERRPLELSLDQSWLCALCNLPQLSRRHMVIARLNQPTNLGENAREVRLFVLVLVPSQEKGTKREVETGRTFATMLADFRFRQRLLRATNELEFKSLMMLQAQQLARAIKLKSRHKYALDAALSHSFSSLAGHEAAAAAAAVHGGQLPAGDSRSSSKRDIWPLKFERNPRTSKLFDLIALNQTSVELAPDNPKAVESSNGAAVKCAPAKPASRNCSGLCRLLARLEFGRGFCQDLTRRLRHYPSDFRDAFVGPPRTPQKTLATIWFLYFGILLPTIAFSSLNTNQTHGHMGDLRKAIIGQALGGLCFALLGGQPLVIIMTTAPLCLYTKVVHQLCLDYDFPFPAMYAAVGLWNALFLVLYSLFGFSKLMRWCTRSTEEIFALFIVVAFVADAAKDTAKNFHRFYYTAACRDQDNRTALATSATRGHADNPLAAATGANLTELSLLGVPLDPATPCRRETSLLFLLLMLGTLWLATSLNKFKRTPYLSAGKRELLADYALPAAVVAMSFVGSFVFDEIFVEHFPPLKELHFERAQVESLPWPALLVSLALGFTLSLLFFMDQNISAAMVDAPQHGLKKGPAYHYDLFVVGLLNGVLATFGLPMMHGVLPHSPLHVRSLADVEEVLEEGHLRQVVVNCRETRVTAIVAHVLVLASLLLIPYPIAYIPSAVLNGLFLYMAITSLDGLHIFERILLLFTEQTKYPPSHYIRRCPQRKIHQFTVLQLFQLAIMCLFGFSPVNIVEMFFPVVILLMIPFRHRVVPKYIDEKYLEALDGKH